MQLQKDLYPSSPLNVSPAITAPRTEYKKEVGKVMTAIISFFVVYIILVFLSVALSVGCVYAGIAVMSASGHLIGIVAGLGIISIGIMVFIFLVKFIFSVKKVDESKMIAVTEDEQPQLYAFIRQLTNDTQTAFPKKIVLSADVNACVFYNDSFWSMFFPVKKNLQIGLGLVNSLTLSEFKAVMAHEFGHFSQKSMKLGSFVYNVNKVIYNMLYENNDYGKFLTGWGSIHAVISIFVWITVQLVKGIQKILEAMYAVINKSYMSLSREMEFHADAVAASVSGSNNCISALRKIELSDTCFNLVLQKADLYLQQKEVLQNVYTKHNVVMKHYAAEFSLPMKNNVPVITDGFLKRFHLSKINIQNQWASHPSMEDRIERLASLHVEAAADDQSAWVLFNNSIQLQEELTAVLYNHLPETLKETIISETIFEEKYLKEADDYKFPEVYNGYYDGRQMNEIDVDKVMSQSAAWPVNSQSLQQCFSDDKVAMPRQLAALKSDAGILENIIHKIIAVKRFDYDGEKYELNDAPLVLDKINGEIEQLEKRIQQDEEANVAFFFAMAARLGNAAADALKNRYQLYFNNRKKMDEFTQAYQQVYTLLSPLLQQQTVSIEAAKKMASELIMESVKLKSLLRYFIDKGIIQKDETIAKAKQFITADYKYFWEDGFLDGDLSSLKTTIDITLNEAGEFIFFNLKSLLQYQLDIVNDAGVVLS